MPTEILNRPAWQFWTDVRIRNAGVAWENDQREAAQAADGGAGTGDSQQKESIVDEQEARADRTDAMDGDAVALEDQLQALDGDG